MTEPKFIQIHFLTTFPGTLLNRDDAGFSKRLPFGGVPRTRVSSQCLKYHWRNFSGKDALYDLEVPKSFRSRNTFRDLIAFPLIKERSEQRVVVAAVNVLKSLLLNGKLPTEKDFTNVLTQKSDAELLEQLKTNQVTVFGEPEVRYLRETAERLAEEIHDAICDERGESENQPLTREQAKTAWEKIKQLNKKDIKKNLEGLKMAAGLDAAMFGRMVTSDILARGDAAIHVAHAFTTHAENSESDYFSVVDELSASEGETGSGYLDTTELTSGLFYNYCVIDVPLLVSNLQAVPREAWKQTDLTLTSLVIERFIRLITTASPGAKLGSTAPYSYAQALMVEIGDSQPCTLANAFQRPVAERPDVLTNSYKALADYVRDIDAMYGFSNVRRIAGIGDIELLLDAAGLEAKSNISDVAKWAAQSIDG